MKCLKSLLWRGVFSIALLVAVSTNANSQTGCTDSNACNFDPGAVTDDGSCAYTGIFIPVNVGDGPAIEACAAPVGYYFADQACVASVVASDPFCIDPAGSWDNLCEEAYNSCLGCVDPAFYIPYNIGTGPAVEVCDGFEPAGYYAPDQACLESVLGSDDYCMTVEWDDLCQNDLDQCTLGCFADWHIPIVAADGPAVRDCGPPAGYWTPDQDCVEFTIAADPFCVETSWDIFCQNDYNTCALGCAGAEWYVPFDVGSGPAQLACPGSEPFGYYAPDQACIETVLLADNTCISDTWDADCQTELNLCTVGCAEPSWYIPYEVGSGPATFACFAPGGYYEADQSCVIDVIENNPACVSGVWDLACQQSYNSCTLGCAFAQWYIPLEVSSGPAVFACFQPAGYWTPDQACVTQVIADDPFCTETEWDILCQNAYTNCSVGCSDAQWYIPTSAGVGPAVLECAPPPGYELPASPICFFEVVAADPFCIQIEWDQVCIDAYDDCTSGCTYEFACNYSPGALFDDGSCGQQGCTDLNAVNFNPSAVCDDGSCVLQNECPADFDNNNTVNAADLLQFLTFFGNTCE